MNIIYGIDLSVRKKDRSYITKDDFRKVYYLWLNTISPVRTLATPDRYDSNRLVCASGELSYEFDNGCISVFAKENPEYQIEIIEEYPVLCDIGRVRHLYEGKRQEHLASKIVFEEPSYIKWAYSK